MRNSPIMKVLLVDDSTTMRTIQHRCLNALGIQDVVEAEDGREALAHFEQAAFDVVLTDWNMPNMDGMALLKEIRSRNRDIPVVMITTEAERKRVVLAIQAGISDYLVKPFTPEDLKKKLQKWVAAGV
jgi:two-component system chemotaxis response regulator CheY